MFKSISIIISITLFSAGFLFSQQNGYLCSKNKIRSNSSGNSLGKITYPGDENIDVKYYKLDLTLNENNSSINGNVTIKAECVSPEISSFYLDLNYSLSVTSVSINSVSVSFEHINDKLIINPGHNIKKGELLEVVIKYGGKPSSSGFGSIEFTSHNGTPAIWTLSEPYGASDWWPCKDTPADKADSADIWITCPQELTPVSNGKLVEIVKQNSRLHTYKWKCGYPIANYLISLAVTNYQIYENEFIYNGGLDTMKLYHYIFPEHFNNQTKTYLDETVDMLNVFSNMFGLYPFIKEKYGHAEFGWGGGMEHQTVSSMGAFFTGIVSHELAHQWFGDKITCADWHHIWLNEGFATYCEALYSERISGQEIYDNMILSDMNSARNASGSLYVQDISTVGSIFNYNRSYAKGSVVLHMLRGVLGDSLFFKVMSSYANDEKLAYSTATIEDFQRVAESVSGLDLQYFFDEWIYGENYPVYTISWDYILTSANAYSVAIELNQQANTNPEYFSMPVDIKVFTSDGDSTLQVWNDQAYQSINLTVSSKPTGIVFDPKNKILKDVIYEQASIVPMDYSVSQNFPNPFNPATKIIYSLPARSDVEIRVYDSIGELLYSDLQTDSHAGKHSYNLNLRNLNKQIASGIYLYTFRTDFGTITKKMVFLK